MTDSTTGKEDESARARAAARAMSARQLEELHRQGNSAFAPGAWDVLDAEVRRRKFEGGGRASPGLRDDTERYPALRIIVLLLKGIAVLVLGIFVLAAISSLLSSRQEGFAGPIGAVLFLVTGAVIAVSYWASAEILVLLMDIEANTRSTRHD